MCLTTIRRRDSAVRTTRANGADAWPAGWGSIPTAPNDRAPTGRYRLERSACAARRSGREQTSSAVELGDPLRLLERELRLQPGQGSAEAEEDAVTEAAVLRLAVGVEARSRRPWRRPWGRQRTATRQGPAATQWRRPIRKAGGKGWPPRSDQRSRPGLGDSHRRPSPRQTGAASEPVNPVPMTAPAGDPWRACPAACSRRRGCATTGRPPRAASASFGQGRARTAVAMSRRSKGTSWPSLRPVRRKAGARAAGGVEIGVSRPGPASTRRST
jgi:hypothetical protein